MKRIIFFSIIFVFISSQAFSVGFGVGVVLEDDSRTVTFPINPTETLRIEPFIGISNSSGNGITENYSKTGAGVFYLNMEAGSSSLFYYGGRFTIDSYSETDNYSRSGQELAPVFGVEHFFSKKFSIGGEAYYSIRTDNYNPDVGASYTKSTSQTGTQVLIRYYFK